MKHLQAYPQTLQDQARAMLAAGALGAMLQRRYPQAHAIRTDGALYDSVSGLKNRCKIVVHELAHLKERAHDKAFYQLCCHMEPDCHQIEFDLRLYLTQREPASRSACLPAQAG